MKTEEQLSDAWDQHIASEFAAKSADQALAQACRELRAARFRHLRLLKSRSAPIQRRWKHTRNQRPTVGLSSSMVKNSGAQMA